MSVIQRPAQGSSDFHEEVVKVTEDFTRPIKEVWLRAVASRMKICVSHKKESLQTKGLIEEKETWK